MVTEATSNSASGTSELEAALITGSHNPATFVNQSPQPEP